MSEDNSTEGQGGELRTLANGAIYDMRIKRIVGAPPKELQPITQENASAMSTLRWEAYRQAAAEGAMRATRRNTPVKAWGYIVERQAELATDIDKGRSSTEAARFVRDGLGLTPQNESSQPAIRIEITGEGLAALAGIVGVGVASDNYSYTKQGGGDGQGDVMEAEWREAEAEE